MLPKSRSHIKEFYHLYKKVSNAVRFNFALVVTGAFHSKLFLDIPSGNEQPDMQWKLAMENRVIPLLPQFAVKVGIIDPPVTN